MLKVEQADREAAAMTAGTGSRFASQLLAGEYDSLSIIQAFAKHREDTALPLREALGHTRYIVQQASDGALTASEALMLINYLMSDPLFPDTTGGE